MLKPCFLFAIGIMVVLSSCQTDDNTALAPECRKVAFSIVDAGSRAEIDKDGNLSFTVGDTIALYSQGLLNDMAGAKAVVADDGKTIALDGDYTYAGENEATFHAFYPSKAAKNENTAQLTVETDQTGDAYAASYLLYCTTSGNATSGRVALTFHHAMAMVKVEVNEANDVESVKLLNVLPQATLTLNGGDALAGSEACTVKAKGEVSDITMHRVDDSTFQAMVPPQTLTSENQIEVLIGNDAYTFKPEENIVLTSGHIYKITLTPSTGSYEFVFPANSLIPEITSETEFKSTTCNLPQSNGNDWKRGTWYWNITYAKDISLLSDGGGFTGTFLYNNIHSSHGYRFPCLIYFSPQKFEIIENKYTLKFDVLSETPGKIGLAIYGKKNSTDNFYYHATDEENGLDSKVDYIEYETSNDLAHIEVTIDPNEGSTNYTVTEIQTSPNSDTIKYYGDNTNKINDCILVFYNAFTFQATYTIKNITLTPNE